MDNSQAEQIVRDRLLSDEVIQLIMEGYGCSRPEAEEIANHFISTMIQIREQTGA